MTRALVTGITGFVGQHLARHLLSIGIEVHGVARSAAQDLPLLDPGLRRRVHLHIHDLSAESDLERTLADVSPDNVYHLAGQAFVPESLRDPVATMEANVLGTVRLLEAIRKAQASRFPRIVVSCSAEIYGLVKPEDCPVTESTPFNPANPYAVSKISQYYLGRQAHATYGLPVVTAAAFNHIGPGQSDRFVVSSFARQLAQISLGMAEPRLVVGNLDARRDFSDVRDVVRAYELLAAHGKAGELHNVCSGRAVPIREMLDRLIALSGLDVTVETDPTRLRPSDLPLLQGDATKLEAATGWKPAFSLDDSLAAVYESWRQALGVQRVTP